jgi:hypothetical protein
MCGRSTHPYVVLGRLVRLRGDGVPRLGRIVDVVVTDRCEALVRWGDAEASFEILEDLVEATPTPS